MSDAACSTITSFSMTLSQQALNTTIWAVVTRQQVDAYAKARREEFRRRISNLKRGGDLQNFFKLIP